MYTNPGKNKCRISKPGDSYLRNLLYMAVICVIRTNERVEEFFVRLVYAGKPQKSGSGCLYEKTIDYRFGTPQKISLKIWQ